MRHMILLAAGLSAAVPDALAQEGESAGAFTGVHVGAEAGAVDHHFIVTKTTASGSTDRNVTKWGLGGALLIGYDTLIGDDLIAGIEAAAQFGGNTPSYNVQGQRFAIKPRWGYSAVARLGYVPTSGFLLYGGGGFGAHNYELHVPAGGSEFGPWNRSFVLTGGAEFRLNGLAALRVSFQHLDGTRNQAMLGVLARF